MEGLIVLILLVVGGLVLVLPIVAVVSASRARAAVRELEKDNEQRKKELRFLYEKLSALEAGSVASTQVAKPEPTDEAEAAAIESDADKMGALPEQDASQAADAASPDAKTAPSEPASSEEITTDAGATKPATPATPVTATAPLSEDAAEAPSDQAAGDEPKIAAKTPTKPKPEKVPLEQQLATWFTRVGAGALLLGILYAFKYLADNDIIGPSGRVAIGIVTGLAILVTAEVIRKTTKPAFVHALTGVGLAALFIAIYASSAFYNLVPVTAAFVANAVVLLLGAALAFRHDAEAVLVLSLIATFANPILLSTGKDNPLGLFGYLFVITSVMLVVAVKRTFRIAISVAVCGVALVAAGWYDRYFQTFDLSNSTHLDLPPEQLFGAYHDLGARAVPLVFLVLFTAQWIASGFGLRKNASLRWSTVIIVAALLLGHLGGTALLYDHLLPLGGMMVVLAIVSVVALRAIERIDLLLIPLLAAVGLLLTLESSSNPQRQLWLIIVLAGWSAIYVAAFITSDKKPDDTFDIEPKVALQSTIALLAFAVVAVATLGQSGQLFAMCATVAGVSIAVAVVCNHPGARKIVAAAMLVSFFLLAFSVDKARGSRLPIAWAYLGAIAGWAAIYVAAIVRAVLKDDGGNTGYRSHWISMMAASAAGLGFVLLALARVPEEASTLRALITAAAGVGDLAAAVVISRRRPDLRNWISLLAAQALGLFAASAAFALTGATITVVWAILAAICAYILSKSREPSWAIALGLLVVFTLARVFGVDIADIDSATLLYRHTAGRQGVYMIEPFINSRALALTGSGIAFLIGARALSKSTTKPLQAGGGLIAVLGYTLLIILAVTEARGLALSLPEPPPVLLDMDEFSAWLDTVNAAEHSQRGKLSMITTVTLAIMAMLLLAIGFSTKSGFHRYLGLVVFLTTIAKLIAWDIWQLPRTYQIVVLVFVGALLVMSGFLYARLKALFTGEDLTKVTTILIFVLGTPAISLAQVAPKPVETHTFEKVRTITGVDDKGDYRIVLDDVLYRHSRSTNPLDDVRIVGPDGIAAPHIVLHTEMPKSEKKQRGKLLDPGTLPDGGYRAMFEIKEPERGHCQVDLDISARGNFLRKTTIETGQTPDDLQIVARGAPVYSISFSKGPRAEHHQLRYASSVARYVRVTLHEDRNAKATRIRGAWFWCSPPPRRPSHRTLPLKIVSSKTDAKKKATVIELDAGAAGVPLERLVLDVKTTEFVRRVQVFASTHRAAWPWAGTGVVYAIEEPGNSHRQVEISLNKGRKRYWRVEISDGDDAPLEVTKVSALVRNSEIVFRTKRGGPHRLYVGDAKAHAPAYDLGDVLARHRQDTKTKTATASEIADNPDFGKPKIDARLPFTERYRGPIGAGVAVILLGLAIWAVRLIKGAEDNPS